MAPLILAGSGSRAMDQRAAHRNWRRPESGDPARPVASM